MKYHFFRWPPTPSLAGPRFRPADRPKSACPPSIYLLYNVPRFSTPLGPLNRPTGARKWSPEIRKKTEVRKVGKLSIATRNKACKSLKIHVTGVLGTENTPPPRITPPLISIILPEGIHYFLTLKPTSRGSKMRLNVR